MTAVDDKTRKVTRIKMSTEDQTSKVNFTIVFQENLSTIKLEENENPSSGKSTRHFDVCLFNVVNYISQKKIIIKCCLTGKMIANYCSKPLVSKPLRTIRSNIMNV